MKNANLVMTAIVMVVLTSCIVHAAPVFPAPPTGNPATPGGLPDMPNKPQPAEITYNGCPPQGDGGDPVLNRLKNRVDEGNYVPVAFDAVFQLTWPKGVERRDHDQWSQVDASAIARYEGIPVSVEGYLAEAKELGDVRPGASRSGGQDTRDDLGDSPYHANRGGATRQVGRTRQLGPIRSSGHAESHPVKDQSVDRRRG
jgi:hypothetical protein